jgi:uncharacterized protein
MKFSSSFSRASLALTLGCAALAPEALAAGSIDCQRADSATERAICATPSLVSQDALLAVRFAAAIRFQPGKGKPALLAEQKRWLARRDACAADLQCLGAQYARRIVEINRPLKAFAPDAVDKAALEDLRRAIEAKGRKNPALALEDALAGLAIENESTDFTNGPDGSTFSTFPERRPSGVTVDEWAALKRSKIEGGGENGSASYQLIDLDGDGLRDLVVDSYIGGTGLFNVISTLPRRGDRFIGKAHSVQQEGDSVLYSLNGRGSNQRAHWVRLQGRIYVAYVDGTYGVDQVQLLRPLKLNDEAPMLSLHYRYRLSVPPEQPAHEQNPARTMSPQMTAALNKAIAPLQDPRAIAPRTDDSPPLCPVPATASADEANSYRAFGFSHYSFETVGEIPVWLDEGDCRVAQLVDWFGLYNGKDGLYAALWMKLNPLSDDHEVFTVNGSRELVKIDSGTAVLTLADGDGPGLR